MCARQSSLEIELKNKSQTHFAICHVSSLALLHYSAGLYQYIDKTIVGSFNSHRWQRKRIQSSPSFRMYKLPPCSLHLIQCLNFWLSMHQLAMHKTSFMLNAATAPPRRSRCRRCRRSLCCRCCRRWRQQWRYLPLVKKFCALCERVKKLVIVRNYENCLIVA